MKTTWKLLICAVLPLLAGVPGMAQQSSPPTYTQSNPLAAPQVQNSYVPQVIPSTCPADDCSTIQSTALSQFEKQIATESIVVAGKLCSLGRYYEAETLLNKVLRMDPDNEAVRHALMMIGRYAGRTVAPITAYTPTTLSSTSDLDLSTFMRPEGNSASSTTKSCCQAEAPAAAGVPARQACSVAACGATPQPVVASAPSCACGDKCKCCKECAGHPDAQGSVLREVAVFQPIAVSAPVPSISVGTSPNVVIAVGTAATPAQRIVRTQSFVTVATTAAQAVPAQIVQVKTIRVHEIVQPGRAKGFYDLPVEQQLQDVLILRRRSCCEAGACSQGAEPGRAVGPVLRQAIIAHPAAAAPTSFKPTSGGSTSRVIYIPVRVPSGTVETPVPNAN